MHHQPCRPSQPHHRLHCPPTLRLLVRLLRLLHHPGQVLSEEEETPEGSGREEATEGVSSSIVIIIIITLIIVIIIVIVIIIFIVIVIVVIFIMLMLKLSLLRRRTSWISDLDQAPPAESFKRKLIDNISAPRHVLPGLSHLVKSITAAKYILTTMTALSLTWLPWLLTLSTDMMGHSLTTNVTNMQCQVRSGGSRLVMLDCCAQTAVQDCVYQLLRDQDFCTLNLSLEDPHQHLVHAVHAYHQESIS